MTWYPDLSEYTYMREYAHPSEIAPDVQKILNVGWLGRGHEFPTGDVPREFIDRLANICARERYAVTRGWHGCDLPHDEKREYPFTIEVNGESFPLGSAEVRVIADDGTTVLAAPNLVWHYVSAHHYRPPEEFVRAVLAHRMAPRVPWG